ncbi:MAG: PEP-CTERM sorting domain-containing protein [Armatimonadota bacterium]
MDVSLGGGLGFALDSTGTPGFSFRSTAGTSGLYYGYQSGGSWTSELIEAGSQTGTGSSLVYDGLTSHIIYGSGSTDLQLNYVTGGPGSWSTPTTIADTEYPRNNDLGLDADGNPAAAWVDGGTGIVGYAYHDGTEWKTAENVASDPRDLSGVALLLPDSAEEAGLFYSDESGGWQGIPTYMQRDSGGNWTADSGAGLSGFEDVAWMSGTLNGDGNPAMAYMDMFTGDLVYAVWDGAAWSTETVEDLPAPSGLPDRNYVDIATDDWGNVHLLYYNPDADQVEYRYRHSGGGWADSLTIHEQANASWMRLSIDDSQKPWFSYYSDVDGEGSVYYGQGTAVPEPATTALFALGLLSAIGLKRRTSNTSSRGQS